MQTAQNETKHVLFSIYVHVYSFYTMTLTYKYFQ